MAEERCVCCGEIIPEGLQVCHNCQAQTRHELTDQWKTEGKCYKCRRKSHCKTTCRANREAAAARVRAAIMKATGMDKAMAFFKELKGE